MSVLGTHNINRCLTQSFAFLVHCFHFQLVGFQLYLEYTVLLLQGIDSLLHLFPCDWRRRHHDGSAVDGRRIALAGTVRHRRGKKQPGGEVKTKKIVEISMTNLQSISQTA